LLTWLAAQDAARAFAKRWPRQRQSRKTMNLPPTEPFALNLIAAHRRRLREVWRSAGWPCQDIIEAELVADGLLDRQRDSEGRETLRVSDRGVQAIVDGVRRNRAARNAHELLVERVAQEMQRAGRVAWRGLQLRAPLPVDERMTWPVVMPDVYSIRHTTVEDYVEPMVHEVKVRRADLLSDLRHAQKGAAYCALSSQCWYVIQAGIGDADEIPPQYGVIVAHADRLELTRTAPKRALRLGLATWMALARANAEAASDDDAQPGLRAMD
jgi:hypothetical protein